MEYGKDIFLKDIEEKTGLKTYSASKLIEEYGKIKFKEDKKTKNINENQKYLINAIKTKNLSGEYILNGHFCLLNEKGKIEKIPIETFYKLNPSKIMILEEKPEIIVARRMIRDNVEVTVEDTRRFQESEIDYGREVARSLNIPIFVFNLNRENEKAIEYIKNSQRVSNKDLMV